MNETLDLIKIYGVDTEKENTLQELLQRTKETIKSLDGDLKVQFYVFRKLCLLLSNHVRTLPKSNGNVDWQGTSDILYFYSLTFNYFMINDFYTCVHPEKEVTVRKCDIPDFTRYFEKSRLYSKGTFR